MKSQSWLRKVANVFLALVFALSGLTTLIPAEPAAAAGTLSVSLYSAAGAPLNAYNLVVDSNVESPSTYAPSVATVAVRFCNTGDADLTNVVGYIGDFEGTSSTPGIYPSRDSSTFGTEHPALVNSGLYAFTHVGGAQGTADASRYIGTLTPRQCNVQYWHFSYPQCENNSDGSADVPPCNVGNSPTWGDSVKPNDDLWLNFDVWATADGNPLGAGSPNSTWKMTMRNEISAMANKIQPNPNGAWFNTNTSVVRPGDVITSNGVLYEFGNVNQGFDNDGNLIPDYNAWAQPVGAPTFDPTCFRLIRTTTTLTVSRSASPQLILNYTDQLYYTNLPSNNTGVLGEVHYTFLALSGPCSLPMTPYQEVASGFDNEKFNGDYGTSGIPPVVSSAAQVTLDKTSSPDVLALGSITTYQLPFQNVGDADAGLTLNSGLGALWGINQPLVLSDVVPDGMQYVCGSATSNLTYKSPTTSGVTIYYSNDGGVTFSTNQATLWSECGDTDPNTNPTSDWSSSKIVIQWWLDDPMPKNSTGHNYAEFQARVPGSGYTGSPFIENCGNARFGSSNLPFAEACDLVVVQGNNSVGDFVWRDMDRDGMQDGGNETGIAGVTVYLYWDVDGDGTVDAEDVLLGTQTTDSNGAYDFTSLPDAYYIVKVDVRDAAIPVGYYATTNTLIPVDLDEPGDVDYNNADFGFGPSLSFDKHLTSGNPSYEGEYVIYHLDVTNNRSGNGEPPGQCVYRSYAGGYTTGSSGAAWINPGNITGAPDGVYATAPLVGNSEDIVANSFNLDPADAGASGTIQKVELLIPVDSIPVAAGTLDIVLYNGTTAIGNVVIGANIASLQGTLIYDVSSLRSWTWNDFRTGSTIRVELVAKKSANPSGDFLVDATIFRVTTAETCGNPSDTITYVPLTDTFDNTKLELVSSTPPYDSVSGGTITWNNIGPIYAGETKEIVVRFRALQPADTDVPTDGEPDPTTHENCAATSNGRFADGALTNSASDCATHTINPAGNIGDLIWMDADGDGVRDTGEPGIPGVNVRLWDCGANNVCDNGGGDDVLVATTTTDGSGAYLFRGVKDTNRNYAVIVDTSTLPSLPSGTTWTNTYDCADAGNNDNRCDAIPIDYDNGSATYDDYLDADFGYRPPRPVVLGTVWHDRDNSQDDYPPDTGEPGLQGVTVYLYYEYEKTKNNWVSCEYPAASGGNDDCVVGTTNVNGDFFLVFPDLTAQNYRNFDVRVVSNTGPLGTGTWTQTYDDDGLTSPHNVFLTATEPTGTNVYRADYSYRRTGTLQIGDTIFVDWNGDGDQDTGEEGLQNVVVELYLDDGDGVVEPGVDYFVGTQTTNSSGYYLFNNLPPDNYVVVVRESTLPSGYVQTADPDETGKCTTCDGRSTLLNLSANNLTRDFGYRPTGTGSIGDTVWRDMNGDGIQSGSSETGISGVTVNLYEDTNGNGVYDATTDALVATTTTDSNGTYLFTGLAAGRYLVDVDTSDTDIPTDSFGQRYRLTTANDPSLVVLTAGQAYLDADFGFAPGGRIGDFVWYDDDGDGSPDDGEPGINGLSVSLYTWTDTNGNGVYDSGEPVSGTPYATTTTANNANGEPGYYAFNSLPAGNYMVQVTQPANTTPTFDPDYCPTTVSATRCFGYDNRSYLVLRGGQVDLTHDFGYQRTRGVIGDTVWIDTDNDGTKDDQEPGIAYVTVYLYNDVNNNNLYDAGTDTLSATTVTDSDGFYLFGGLTDGEYVVVVDTGDPDWPSGATQTYDPDGTLNNQSDVSISGNSNLTRDFGYQVYTTNNPNSVSGTVFFDVGNNGGTYVSGTDVPIGNVTVYLYNQAGQLVRTTVADPTTGFYQFTGLPAGTYSVVIDASASQLEGLLQTSEPDDTLCTDGGSSCNNRTAVSLSGGQAVTQRDFGFYANMDCGDLPNTYNAVSTRYNVNLSNAGPCHINVTPDPVTGNPTHYLGTRWDNDFDGQPSATAVGDDNDGTDDEDGITPNTLLGNWTANTTVRLNVTVVGSNAYLAGWFDWNDDGDFFDENTGEYDTGEYQYFDYLPQGPHIIDVRIPGTFVRGSTTRFLNWRFRLYIGNSPPSVIAPTGNVTEGEVEDGQYEFPPTAITLAAFEATPRDNGILVTWETAMELDNVGFNLYRSTAAAGPYTQLNAELIPPQFPGEVMGGYYEWLDTDVEPGVTYYYKLEDIDVKGVSTFNGPISTAVGTAPTAVQIQSVAVRTALAPAALGLVLLGGLLVIYRRRRER